MSPGAVEKIHAAHMDLQQAGGGSGRGGAHSQGWGWGWGWAHGSLDHLEVVQDGHDVLRHEDVAGVDGHGGHGDQEGVWRRHVEETSEARLVTTKPGPVSSTNPIVFQEHIGLCAVDFERL